MEKPSSVWVLAGGSLGDCLLTLPALQSLQSRFSVTVAGTPPYRDLGPALLGVDEVVSLEPLLQALYAEDLGKLPKFFREDGEVFLFFKDPDPKLQRAFSLFPNLKIHEPTKKFSEFLDEGRWAGHYWWDLAQGEKNSEDCPPARLKISEALRTRGKEICDEISLGSPFAIHPGSGSRTKNAPLSFFQKAAQRASAESNRKILVLWGEAETKWLGEIQQAFKDIPKTLVPPEPFGLKDLVSLFTQCSAYLGNDSGVTHLAAACGARTFAVFNQTDSRIWGPQEAIILETLRTLYA